MEAEFFINRRFNEKEERGAGKRDDFIVRIRDGNYSQLHLYHISFAMNNFSSPIMKYREIVP